MSINDFEDLLESVKKDLLLRRDLASIKDTKFEKIFAEKLREKLHGALAVEYKEGSTIFPDIGCAPYGVEIKTTKADKWVCLGNSIMEGTRRNGVEIIYVAFLKKGGIPDIRILPYSDSISDIKVTHSPRYEINMDIPDKKQTIFPKLGIAYNEFKDTPNKIQRLKKYYKDKGVASWWLDDEVEETVTTMNLIPFNKLSHTDKKKFRIEIFTLFPEVLNHEFGEAASYLLFKYGIFNPSFRDMISAGGKEAVVIKDHKETVSKSVATLISLLPNIVSFIDNSKDLIIQQWEIKNNIDLVDHWFKTSEQYLQKAKKVLKPSIPLKEIYTIRSKQE